MLTDEQRRTLQTEALKRLKALDVARDYYDVFANDNIVTLYQHYAGFYATDWNMPDTDIEKHIKQIEDEFDCIVYAITEEFYTFGYCLTFLVVTKYKEDWDYEFDMTDTHHFTCYAYVENLDAPQNSEFGSVGIKSMMGGLMREY